jgi:predicted methyltransferase
MVSKTRVLNFAIETANSRPVANNKIEQTLMTPESMANQVVTLCSLLMGKKVFFLGDDDHMSLLFAKFCDVKPVVMEIDKRIRENLEKQYKKNCVFNYRIFNYDARDELVTKEKCELFYVNPPYSSKNNGKGAKVWIFRASKVVPVGSTSVLVYPISEDIVWTMNCFNSIQNFVQECGFSVVNIDRDIHTYYGLNDSGLYSSNIYLYKQANASKSLLGQLGDITGEKLYRE